MMLYKKLGDIALVNWGNTSITKKEYKTTGYRAYSAAGQDGFHDKYDFDEEGIVLSAIGADCGKCFYASGKWIAIKNTITITKDKSSNPQVYLPYLFRYLNNKSIWPKSGGGQPFITQKGAKSVKVPVPKKITDQIRIATILNKTETLIQQRKESIGLLDELLKSIFLEMFGNPVRNEKGWEILRFAKVAHNENSNRIPIKELDRDLIRGDYPYFGATGIIDYINDYKFDGEFLLIAEDGKNLLFQKRNNAFIAKGKFWVNNHAHVLAFNGICHLRYLEFFLNNIDLKPYITGVDQIKLNKDNLDRIPVPVPSFEVQIQFAEIVEKVEALKTQYKTSLTELENLYGSFSQRAFKGELDLSKLEIEEPHDNRYGDPFEVDEETAMQQGQFFYNEWKRLYNAPGDISALNVDEQNEIEQTRGTLYSFGWRTGGEWVNKTKEAVADKLTLEELRKLEFRYLKFSFEDPESDIIDTAPSYGYQKVEVNVLSARKFGELKVFVLQSEQGSDPDKYRDKIFQLFFSKKERWGNESMSAFNNLDDLTMVIFLNFRDNPSGIFQIKFNYHSSVFRNRKKEPQLATHLQLAKNKWLQYYEIEGILLLNDLLGKKGYFDFPEFSRKVKERGFKVSYAELKQFIFEALSAKENIIEQYYSNPDWLATHRRVGPGPDDFAGDGKIYIVSKNRKGS